MSHWFWLNHLTTNGTELLEQVITPSQVGADFMHARSFEAIDYIHTNLHYIHRDIKPDNILFDIDGSAAALALALALASGRGMHTGCKAFFAGNILMSTPKRIGLLFYFPKIMFGVSCFGRSPLASRRGLFLPACFAPAVLKGRLVIFEGAQPPVE